MSTVHQMNINDALYDAQKFLLYYYKLRKVPYLHMIKVLGINIHIIRVNIFCFCGACLSWSGILIDIPTISMPIINITNHLKISAIILGR